jgi:membrane-bound lytic murein transglycosylase D
MRVKSLPFIVLLFLSFRLLAQEPASDSVRGPVTLSDDPVASMLDSLADLTIFRDNVHLNTTKNNGYSSDYIPYFSDSVYRERIADMNDQSPFEYVYNSQVRMFIDLYAYRKRALTARIIGLSQIYFPLFEEQLDKYNMPLELKYLAVIESALNPIANSRAGAKGLWQFMYGTGKVYGLKVTSYVDDRYDPYKSTIAACEHLKDLYDIYGNWSLALAAYNSGAGNVNKAIRRAGGIKNFWTIYPYLPRETRSYVPAFIAASYVLTYANQHNIKPVDPGILYYDIDTVVVKNVLTFDQISEMLHVPMEELIFLNPWFKSKVIPATPEFPYSLRLKKEYVGNFVSNEAALYAYKTRTNLHKDSLQVMVDNSYRSTQVYVVRSGDNMASIAKKFNMTVSELKALNNLQKNYVKSRQRLLVYTKDSRVEPLPPSVTSGNKQEPSAVSKEEPRVEPAPAASTSYHVVKSGETLGTIAGKYHCTVSQIMSWNNLSKSTIYVGQKLKVSGSAHTTSGSSTSSSAKTATSSGSAKYTWYTIKAGDNLWDIAQENDCTVSQIKALNNITNINRLKAGQKIKIPTGK